jgi:hypothetical protein
MTPHPPAIVVGLHLAWEYSEILPGDFERDREGFQGRKFPIVGPLPSQGRQTRPLEAPSLDGPYLYAMYDAKNVIRYIGVVTEKDCNNFLERWIRPDKHTGKHYWTHGTNKKGKSTVEWIADGLRAGLGPIRLYFSNYRHLLPAVAAHAESKGVDISSYKALPPGTFLEKLEHAWIYLLQPDWNKSRKKRPPGNLWIASDYWARA